MDIVCLDLEGVLVPEIWIAFAEKTGIEELKITTRDEPDYHKLMDYRIGILRSHGLFLSDIQSVIAGIKPLPGAYDFVMKVREMTQLVILSDTFTEFALPLMRQLDYPTILCNSLKVDSDGCITGINMRAENGKKKAIEGFRHMGFRTFASGDSYNDIAMIREADGGCLFRAPENIIKEEKDLEIVSSYDGLIDAIRRFRDEE